MATIDLTVDTVERVIQAVRDLDMDDARRKLTRSA